jgi:hypothetical protein
MRRVLLSLLVVGLMTVPALGFGPNDVKKITVHELNEKMARGDRVIVLDMRVGGDYTHSNLKIKGDVRMPLQSIDTRANELPMGYEIVTYCT